MATNLTCTLYGDYYIPDIKLSETAEQKPLGKHGRMRKTYLKEHCSLRWNSMILSRACVNIFASLGAIIMGGGMNLIMTDLKNLLIIYGRATVNIVSAPSPLPFSQKYNGYRRSQFL